MVKGRVQHGLCHTWSDHYAHIVEISLHEYIHRPGEHSMIVHVVVNNVIAKGT